MLEALKESVLQANRALAARGLALQTWGNASGIDRAAGAVVIKPSGVPYDRLTAPDMSVVKLTGNPIEGLKPSVDAPVHLALYRGFAAIGGVVHTHSHYATVWAQACRPIPCLGTTHADYFYGEVPVTAKLGPDEAGEDYETRIGESIVRAFAERDPLECPAVLVANHAPFVWGRTVEEALENAVVLEEIARLALHTLLLSPGSSSIPAHLLDRHFSRKHGGRAYYGQPTGGNDGAHP